MQVVDFAAIHCPKKYMLLLVLGLSAKEQKEGCASFGEQSESSAKQALLGDDSLVSLLPILFAFAFLTAFRRVIGPWNLVFLTNRMSKVKPKKGIPVDRGNPALNCSQACRLIGKVKKETRLLLT